MTATELLETAFAFADTDLAALPPVMLRRVKREIGLVLLSAPPEGPGTYTGGVWAGSQLPDFSDYDLYQLRAAVRLILPSAASRTPISEKNRYKVAVSVTTLPVVTSTGEVVLHVMPDVPVRDRYLLILQLLLRHVG